MAFPKLALLTGIVTLLVMRILGVPSLISLALGAVIFMAMGGMQYTRVVIKYLPRDLW